MFRRRLPHSSLFARLHPSTIGVVVLIIAAVSFILWLALSTLSALRAL